MRLERQNAYPSAEHDVFRAIDWMFPRGLDHHEMFAGVPVAQSVMAKVARHLAGLGLLPEKPAPTAAPREVVSTDVAIIGAGAAGLAAAAALASKRVGFLLCEQEEFLGGRLAISAIEPGAPEIPAADALPVDVLRLGSSAIGVYQDASGRFVVVVRRTAAGARLLVVYAKRFLIAVGGHPRLLPFENNDLPGIFAGRGASYLLRRCAVLPGKQVALVGEGRELYLLAALLQKSGASLSVLIDLTGTPPPDAPPSWFHGTVVKAHGRTAVSALSFETALGKKRVSCDAVIVSAPPAPSYELARQAGARVRFQLDRGGFIVEADDDGRSSAPDVFVAGEMLGPMSAAQAANSGQRAAEAISKEIR
jgi:sarcosine oxidase subunit alpha